MTTYEQKYSFNNTFDYSAAISPQKSEILIRVSDSYEGLFVDSSLCTTVDCIDADSIDKDRSGGSAKAKEDEFTFSINEATFRTHQGNTSDQEFMNFLYAGLQKEVYRYVAVFQNTVNPPIAQDMDFIGVLQRELSSDSIKWDGSDYSTTRNIFSIHNFKVAPFRASQIEEIKLKDLIFGVVENLEEDIKPVVGIEPTWESSNVAHRAGYYNYDGKTVVAYRLVSLDRIIRKLADNLTATLALKNIDLHFTFARSKIDGLAIPARWNHPDLTDSKYDEKIKRHVYFRAPEYDDGGKKSYEVYPEDAQQLFIDPDNSYSAFEQIWINYNVIKPHIEDNKIVHEIVPSAAKEFRWGERVDNFVDLLYLIAENFGMSLDMRYTSSNIIDVKFVGRSAFNKDKIYFKDATQLKRSVGGSSVLSSEDMYTGKAFYYAGNGDDIYIWQRINDTYIASTKSQGGERKLLMTISPTLREIYHKDYYYQINFFLQYRSRMPHGYCFANDSFEISYGTGVENTTGITTAMFMFTNRNPNHPNYTKEPLQYFTNIAQWNINIGDQTKNYNSLAQYLNDLNGYDSEFLKDEINLSVPSWNAFSNMQSSSGKDWHLLQIGSVIELNNTEYTIVGIKKSLRSLKIDLKLHGVTRFSGISSPLNAIVGEVENTDTFINPDNSTLSGFEVIASGSINQLDVVSIIDDNTYRRAIPLASDYDLIEAISLSTAEDGEVIQIAKSGEITDTYFSQFDIGTILWLRDTSTGPNLGDFLTTKNASENLRCPAFKVIGSNKAKILLDWKAIIE